MDEENVSLFHMGFLKQGKLQVQRIDVASIDFIVLKLKTSIFDSRWIKMFLCQRYCAGNLQITDIVWI